MNPLTPISALPQVQGMTPGQLDLPPAQGLFPNVPALSTSGPNFSEALTQATSASNAGTFTAPATWGQLVQRLVLDVNHKQVNASQKVMDVLEGGPTPVHDALAATEEANLSFTFLAEMRNKVVEAYQQVMQMQV